MAVTVLIYSTRSGDGVIYYGSVNAVATALPNRTLIHENEHSGLSAAETLTASGKC